jgi:hypothetical protein
VVAIFSELKSCAPSRSLSFFLCFGRSFIYLVVLGSFRRTVAGGRGSRQRRLEPAYWVWPLALVQRGSYRPTSAGTAFPPPPPLLCALQRQRNRCALPESSSDNEARTHKAHDNAGSSIDPRRECESGYCDHDRPREETTQAEGDVVRVCARARLMIHRSSVAARRVVDPSLIVSTIHLIAHTEIMRPSFTFYHH